MFHPNSDKNRFGYYSAGAYKTYSKFDALEVGLKTGNQVKWHFNEEFYSTANWLVEPELSLRDIYKHRAKKLRDQYDYLVLMFSGGIDSINMLNVFVDNNIHLDEICSIHEYNGAKDPNSYQTGEILFEAVPYIKKLKLTNTHFRLVDSSETQHSFVTSFDVGLREQSYYDLNAQLNLGALSKWDIRKQVPEYQKIIDSGKKLCLIFGEGKPVIHYDTQNNKHKFIFNNQTVNDMICPPRQQRENHSGQFDEMFYHGDTDIVVKQSHLLLKYLNNPDTKNFVDLASIEPCITITCGGVNVTIKNPIVSDIRTYFQGQHLCLKSSILNEVIYPGTVPPIYDQGKNLNKVYNPRDEWLRKADPKSSKKWYTGYVQRANKLGIFERYDRNKTHQNQYFIE